MVKISIKTIFNDFWYIVFTIPQELRAIIFKDRSLIKVLTDCAARMLLWRIWHPKYGTIFDLSRDGPFENEQKDNANKIVKDRQDKHTNMHPFSQQ